MWVKSKEITIREAESIAAFHSAQPSPAQQDCLELACHLEGLGSGQWMQRLAGVDRRGSGVCSGVQRPIGNHLICITQLSVPAKSPDSSPAGERESEGKERQEG
ncbi:hypothetical protein MHYP_G00201390 [Metynnis hypsauchen]